MQPRPARPAPCPPCRRCRLPPLLLALALALALALLVPTAAGQGDSGRPEKGAEGAATDARADAFGRPWLPRPAHWPSDKDGGLVFATLLLQSQRATQAAEGAAPDADANPGPGPEPASTLVLFHSEVHYPYGYLGHHAVLSPGAAMKPEKRGAAAPAPPPARTECSAGAQALDLDLPGVRASLGLECVYGGLGTDTVEVRVPVLSSTQQVTRCPLPQAPPVAFAQGAREPLSAEMQRRLRWPQHGPWSGGDAAVSNDGPSGARGRGPQLRPAPASAAWAGVPVTLAFRGRIAARAAGVRVPHLAYPAVSGPAALSIGKRHRLCACASVWHRAEFLEEWLRYYTVVHGLQLSFFYDNGSVQDDLAAVIEYLSAFYNIDYTWFPQRRSQPAYMAHCLLRAAPVCSWVMFYDPDEYLTLTPAAAGGRLDDYLGAQPAHVGLVKVLMSNYRSSKGVRIFGGRKKGRG